METGQMVPSQFFINLSPESILISHLSSWFVPPKPPVPSLRQRSSVRVRFSSKILRVKHLLPIPMSPNPLQKFSFKHWPSRSPFTSTLVEVLEDTKGLWHSLWRPLGLSFSNPGLGQECNECLTTPYVIGFIRLYISGSVVSSYLLTMPSGVPTFQ